MHYFQGSREHRPPWESHLYSLVSVANDACTCITHYKQIQLRSGAVAKWYSGGSELRVNLVPIYILSPPHVYASSRHFTDHFKAMLLLCIIFVIYVSCVFL